MGLMEGFYLAGVLDVTQIGMGPDGGKKSIFCLSPGQSRFQSPDWIGPMLL